MAGPEEKRAERGGASTSRAAPRPDSHRIGALGRGLAWMLPFGLLILSIVSVPVSILDEQGLPRYRALKGELFEVRRVNDRLRREVEQLHRDVDGLRSDPEAIERIARDELGMVRQDEILFQFPN